MPLNGLPLLAGRPPIHAVRGRLASDGAHDGNSDHRAEGGGSQITSHAFDHRSNPPWGLCGVPDEFDRPCGLSEAAHATSATPYVPDAPRAVA